MNINIQESPLMRAYRARLVEELSSDLVRRTVWRHQFVRDPLANVQNQCQSCWGWYDDIRHL